MIIPSTVTVTMPYDMGSYKINIIKAIRELSSLGLKEAKDISELSGPQVVPVRISVYNAVSGSYIKDPAAYPEIVNRLRSFGVTVADNTHCNDILESVRRLAVEATLKNELNLARVLIGVLSDFS